MTKKNEILDQQLIKKTSALLLAIICLIGGVIIGMVSSKLGIDHQSGEKSNKKISSPTVQIQRDSEGSKLFKNVLKLQLEVYQNPKNFQAWKMLGDVYFDLNAYGNAIYVYKKSLELNPQNANTWTDLGIMYRRNGNPHEAIKAFDQAIKMDSHHEQCRFNKGIVLMHDLNDLPAAIKCWEDLVRINPQAKSFDGTFVKDLIEKMKAEI